MPSVSARCSTRSATSPSPASRAPRTSSVAARSAASATQRRVGAAGLDALEEPVARRQRAVVRAARSPAPRYVAARVTRRAALRIRWSLTGYVGAELLGQQRDAVLLEHPPRPAQLLARRPARRAAPRPGGGRPPAASATWSISCAVAGDLGRRAARGGAGSPGGTSGSGAAGRPRPRRGSRGATSRRQLLAHVLQRGQRAPARRGR